MASGSDVPPGRYRLQNSFVNVTAGTKGGKKLDYMVRAAGFHGDIDRRIAEIHAVVRAVVRSFNDVGAVLRQNACESMKSTGIIRQMDAKAHQSPIFHQAALHDSREQADIDVSATDQHCNSFAAERGLAVDKSCNGRGTGAFGQSFFALQQK